MRKLIKLVIVGFFSCVSREQDSLIGEWKPVKVIVYDAFNNTTSVLFDKDNQETAKRNLLNEYISKSKNDSDVIESKLDKDFLRFDSASLTFKKDSTIFIENYGLIIPTTIPGWAFGEKLGGRWTQSGEKLKLLIGESTLCLQDQKTYK